MLFLLVFLPIIAFIAILLGAPARLTAVAASALNLVLGIIAAFTWQNAGVQHGDRRGSGRVGGCGPRVKRKERNQGAEADDE